MEAFSGFWVALAATLKVTPLLRYKVGLDFLEQYIPGLLQQNVGDITTAARDLLHMDNMVVLVVGDLATIEEPVRGVGWGEVTIIDASGRPVEPDA